MFLAHRRKSDGREQCLAQHLTGVSAIASENASKVGLGYAGELVGLLHDLGKYSIEFLHYLQSAEGLIDPDADGYVDAAALKGKIDHSTAGAQYVWNHLSESGNLGIFVGQLLALCIASHHSGLIDCISADSKSCGEDTFTRRMRKAREKTHLDEVVNAADAQVLTRATELLAEPQLFTSVERFASSICRSSIHRPIAIQQQFGLMVRFLFSCLIDADRTDTADFEHASVSASRQRGAYTGWDVLAERLETHLEGLAPRHPIDRLRRDISQHCFDAASREKGIFTLTVPTGGGKTLASLRFALHHARIRQLDRIVYVIPYTSIIDQNAEVARKILETSPQDHGRIVLEHHSNLTPERQTWREKVLCENWDAPVVFTTMVQFLESLFGRGTRGARRMHQLANSVLIFDEVQTLPVKCVHLFNNAVNFLMEQTNSTVVLCTATQPLLDRVPAEKGAIHLSPGAEIMPDRQKLFDELKRVEVRDVRKPGGWSYEEVARLAVEQVRSQGSCLVVVNTKKAARHVYRLCKGMDESELVHLSTDMCPAHRKQQLDLIRDRLRDGLPVLCVSTQLIEAGVDVDFRVVVRFVAGIDSIAQAAGRCNRNGAPQPGIVYIVNPAEEDLTRLPDIAKASHEGQRILDDYRAAPERFRHNLFGQEAMEEYYRYYFVERSGDMRYSVAAGRGGIGHDDTLLNLLSANDVSVKEYGRNKGANPPLHFRQAFMTAASLFESIDVSTQGVIVPFGKEGEHLINELCAAYEVKQQYQLLKRAQQFTVNVTPHVLRRLAEVGAVYPIQKDTGILYLDKRYYSNDYGLTTEPIAEMELMSD